MRVTLDDDRCRGHGICCSLSPEIFSMTDDGYSQVLLPEVPPGLEEMVSAAERRCPERAITTSQ